MADNCLKIQQFLKVNFDKGRGRQKPLIVVLHIIGLPGKTAETAIARFQNPKEEVSAHYICKRNGEIIQLVREEDNAWCNGIVINPANPLVKMYFKQNVSINQISISIEHEGSEYEDITEAQYTATSKLVREICQRWSIPVNRTHIMGHREIRNTKTCPGKLNVDKVVKMASIATPPEVPQPIPQPIVPTRIEPKKTLMPQWMINFLQRSLGSYFNLETLGAARSLGWSLKKKEFARTHPKVCFCGKTKVQLHHKLPFSQDPSKELSDDNLTWLCQGLGTWNHHLEFGHLGSFHSWNEDIDNDAIMWKQKILNRP